MPTYLGGKVCTEEPHLSEKTDSSIYAFSQKEKGVRIEKCGEALSLQCQVLFQNNAFSLNQMKCN